jgi:hypothetical protein
MSRLRRPPFFWLLIFLLAILILFAAGRIAPHDEETVYRMTANLIEHGQLTLTQQTFTLEPQTYPGFLPHILPREQATTWTGLAPNGVRYPLYTHAQPLLQIPLYVIGRIIGGPPNNLMAVALTRFTVSLLDPIAVALTGWLIALFGLRWGFSNRLSIGLGLIYSLCAMPLVYTHTNFTDPVLALLMTLAAYSAYRARADGEWPWLLWMGVALGLALYLRERSLIVLPIFVGYVIVTRRVRALRGWIALLLPIGLAGLALAVWNWVRFGSPVTVGYANWVPDTGFGTPLLLGLYGLLISPGKGLLIYNPIVWLGVIGLIALPRRRDEAVLFILIALVSLVFYASYNFWTGGWNWGPRYMLVLMPFLLLGAGDWVHSHPTRLWRSALIGLSVLTLALNMPALLVDQSRYLVGFGERDPDHYLERAVLRIEDSPLTQQWPTVFEVAAMYARPETWMAAQQALDAHLQSYHGDNDLESLSTHLMWVDEFFRLNVPDFWFAHLILLGFLPIVVGLIVATLLGVVIVAGRHVWLMLK